MKNTTPTQDELANYITNTGCDWEWQDHDGSWSSETGQYTADFLRCEGHQIRIALTPYGLPSHLEPHNPAGLSAEQITEGGRWRCLSEAEMSSQVGEACVVQKWNTHWKVFDDNGGVGYRPCKPASTYRLPAAVPFPDWEDMSKTPRATAVLVKPGRALLENPLQYEATAKDSSTPQPALRVIDVPLKVAPRELSERRTSQPTPMQPAPGETPECDKVEDARRGFGLPRGPAYGDLLKVAQNLERENQRLRYALEGLLEDAITVTPLRNSAAVDKAAKILNNP